MDRTSIDKKYIWNLEDIYKSDKDFKNDFNSLSEYLEKLENFKSNLAKDSNTLYNCLSLYDTLNQKFDKVYSYASLKHNENTKDAKYQSLYQKVIAFSSQFSSSVAFVYTEILSIDDNILNKYIEENEELKKYDIFIKEIIRNKKHILSQKEEELLGKLSDFSNSPSSIFKMYDNADISFNDVQDSNGKTHNLTHGNYILMLTSKDKVLRENAFKEMANQYIKNKNTLSEILLSNIKKDVFYKTVRKYNSSIQQALDEDNIDVSVYNNLIKSVDEGLPILQRYLSLKKKVLNLDEFHLYDCYLNVASESDKKVNYDDAVDIVLKALSVLGDKYIKDLKNGFDSRWVDVFETDGKRSGAYESQVYGVHPYVSLNYNSSIEDVSTIAHELGHAMHSYYTINTQPYIYANYKIFVAEVASTVNECLLSEYLIKNEKDKQTKIYLLNDFIEKIRLTIFRQTMFAEFEKIVHEKVENMESLTSDDMCNIYYELNKKYFGKDVIVDKEIEIEWARIPHFYNSFYVYKYATGMSAALAISSRIISGDNTTLTNYLEFLKKGDSQYPIDLLKAVGVDLSTDKPVKEAMKVFEEKVSELTELIN